jgi:hypothetical protein
MVFKKDQNPDVRIPAADGCHSGCGVRRVVQLVDVNYS